MSSSLDDRFPIVCFGDDWGKHQTSNQHLMRAFVRRGHRVVWINSIGARPPRFDLGDARKMASKLWSALRPADEPQGNPLVVSPLALPLPHCRWARRVNVHRLSRHLRGILQQHDIEDHVLWICGPIAAEFIGTLGEKASVYYCADEYDALPRAPVSALRELEAHALTSADITVVVSERLLKNKSSQANRIALLRHGVDHAHFRRAMLDETRIPAAMADIPQPVIGLIGRIDDWMDTDLLAHIATSRPEWSIVVVGPVVTRSRAWMKLRNVHCLGPRPYRDLPSYMKAMAATILPYRVNQQTLCCNPLKLREYLAAGRPVVSVAVPEVQQYLPWVRVAQSADEFVASIGDALDGDGPQPQRARSECVAGESWDRRAEEVVALLSPDPKSRRQIEASTPGRW
ncbi:MAG: glycosyltransferase [Armatimonadota bacterium]|nr:glycosyltransferase [Armatimonadota bacterium]